MSTQEISPLQTSLQDLYTNKRLRPAFANKKELKIRETSLALDHELFGASLLLRIVKGLSSDHVTLTNNPKIAMSNCLPTILPFSDAFDDYFDTTSQPEVEKFFYNTLVKTARRIGKETDPKDYTQKEHDLIEAWNNLEQKNGFKGKVLSNIFQHFNITVHLKSAQSKT